MFLDVEFSLYLIVTQKGVRVKYKYNFEVKMPKEHFTDIFNDVFLRFVAFRGMKICAFQTLIFFILRLCEIFGQGLLTSVTTLRVFI